MLGKCCNFRVANESIPKNMTFEQSSRQDILMSGEDVLWAEGIASAKAQRWGLARCV